jgi:hypothetical protein
VLAQKHVDDVFGVFPRTGHHQAGPPGAVCRIDIKALLLHQKLDDGEAVVGHSPVHRQAVVGVTQRRELGIRGEEGLDSLGWRG